MTKRSKPSEEKNDLYNWVPSRNKDFDSRIEPEDDASQIEALMVDCGRTKLLHGWE